MIYIRWKTHRTVAWTIFSICCLTPLTLYAQTLDIRDATIYLDRQHNPDQPLAVRATLGLASQIPIQDLAVAVDTANNRNTFLFETRGAWFYELKLSLSLFHPFEVYGILQYGQFQLESIISPAVDRTLSMDITMIGMGGGLKIKVLRGDFVPYLTGFGGITPTTYSLQQNFNPFIQQNISLTSTFFGGGGGLDLFISRHVGANLQVSAVYYAGTPAFADFTSRAFTHKPLFIDPLVHMMIHTSLFYEF